MGTHAARYSKDGAVGGGCLRTGEKPPESAAVSDRIYLDHNATTPVRVEVAEAVAAALRGGAGNASSVHAAGRAARAAVESARREVAALLGASAEEIVFTSGGTEGNNVVLRGLARSAGAARPHVVTSRLEHPSVVGALEAE